jgi:hypothetical protein
VSIIKKETVKTKFNLLTVLPFVLLAMIFLASLSAQTITNVHARQEGLEIIITYDMAGELKKNDKIKVGYSTDGGRGYKTISGAEGDVGKNVKPGTGKEISFLANDALAGKNAMLKVEVKSIVFTSLENMLVAPNPTSGPVQFINLPEQCTITVFNLNGERVITLEHSDPDNVNYIWDMKTENNHFISDGLYIYQAETPGGDQKIGKFIIMRNIVPAR